ncbi:MAG TPA: hypothetical protein VHO01_06285, partial [Jatrophihabitans sp.]|nr:hypothetical protein [Jatrophihabitans sp.]
MSMPLLGVDTTVPPAPTATVLICELASWVTLKVAELPAIAPVVVEAMTDVDEEVAAAAAQVLLLFTASAAVCSAC